MDLLGVDDEDVGQIKLVANTSIVVIHPGSCNLRLGLASDAFPHVLPHCIAYRHKSPGQQKHYEDLVLTRPQAQLANNKQQMRAGLQAAHETVQRRPTSLSTYRQATSNKQLSEMNSGVTAEKSDVLSPVTWTSTSNKPEFLVGKEALYVQPSDCYNLHWPIQRGRLNIHSNGPNGTLTAVLLQLERIWGVAMETLLDIPATSRKNYKAVLLIPDIYSQQHVREMISVLLNGLGFNAAFVVQESVCATLGSGISSACVVDVGDQKTSVCCVEDGLSQKNTRVCMEYGGCDISRCFHWLLTRAGLPYKQCDITDRMDTLLLQELKETYCHLDQDVVGMSDIHIQVRPPGRHIVTYTMQLADERLLAPTRLHQLVANTSIVVIHPGSCNLRLGLASDAFPHVLPHCIAYRHKSPGQQKHYEDLVLTRPQAQLANNKQQMRAGLQAAHETVQRRPTSLSTYRQATSNKQLSEMNSGVTAEKSDVLSPVTWTSTSNKPEFLVGKEALYVQPSDCYNLHWPIQRGRLNIHSNGPNGTLTAVLLQLERIWGVAMETLLDIPATSRKNYKAVLLIPDIYSQQHVREMISVLLNGLGFNAAFVVQESVCATLGSGISSACVVDVGDQKTSVCCVEDGLSQKNTRVCMEYGGCDISRCFHWLLTRAGLPYKQCDITDRMDTLLLQELKETYCHLDQDVVGMSDIHIQVRPPGRHIVTYTMQLADERLLAPMAVFHPDMFGLQKAAHVLRVAEKYRSDPSDPYDDDYLVQTQSRHEQVARLIAARKRENAEAASQNTDDLAMDDDDTMDQSECSTSDVITNTSVGGNGLGGSTGTKQVKKVEEEDEGVNLDDMGLLGLDQAILGSIEKCETDDMKKRMYSCIVVVGGGLAFPGAQSWLQYLLWIQMPPHVRLSLETMDVYTRPKDLDPTVVCWKGGAVICCLDTAQELWISQSEWRQLGVKILRERAPFVW